MTVDTSESRSTTSRRGGGYLDRPSSSSLADVVELILDKGLVIDAYVRVSLVGIEILTIDARIVIASVDTYLRFAEATNRLDLYKQGGKDLGDMMGSATESTAKGKTEGVLTGAKNAIMGSDDDDEAEGHESRPQRRPAKKPTQRRKQQEDA
ncbi:gas vesicle protein GvpJ [Isoptericola cucumis]|uniref:Gas vesicle protein A n=1 Tax=Isoptericola cucumis TaxID=1776856 RepID=A0ABQ2B539_9MICO|nr:gas vesicle protein GvpJ [Isoptericola cucumis]GGI06744.1 putative gas vesicle structural protein 1 [Isoptericola cucumis]